MHMLIETVKGHVVMELGNFTVTGKALEDITSPGPQSS